MMKIKAIIFDCDGVLVDSESITMKVFIELFAKYGATMTYQEALDKFVGKAFNQILDCIEEEYDVELPSDFEDQFRAQTFAAFKTDIQPIEGIKEVLSQLKLPYAVASNGPMSKMQLNLTTTGLIQYFDHHLYSAYDLKAWKPDPKLFIHAATQLGFSPEECLVIEDSLSGVEAALNGGFKVMAYVDGAEKEIFNQKGVKTFDKMIDLLDL
ncbi:HAD-IA family hydrolase [Flammeovirga yaeyamensis]|uniref:HAD-IA family hydrolase n=1 Tax=Flammeovirga yaeyamensis TaxID=367791 RepID=A0AAX1NEM0_9BACT|nr:HAD-IA family hydrolase [Flammeovirga yaeyamensis]MBB3697011.1 HAD superfamily hydrolase (TIGR01509 family) [Flammeovirga yaeyamensis]NMF33674.1 HAD-IA family hydrolase [Flammeovirga yaeyamensis]QWG05060.1 HAD-IA family hydrolase [Flammeovirga yaeyamensis]